MTFDCSVCCESLEDTPDGQPGSSLAKSHKSRKTVCTPCGHLFHKECLDKWLNSSASAHNCPSCRLALYQRKRTTQGITNLLPDEQPAEKNATATNGSAAVLGQAATTCSTCKTNSKPQKEPFTDQFLGCVCPLDCLCKDCRVARSKFGTQPDVCCQDLRRRHSVLQNEAKTLEDTCNTRDEEMLLLPVKRVSLAEEKAKLLQLEKEQAEIIRKLLKRPVCKCQPKPEAKSTLTADNPAPPAPDTSGPTTASKTIVGLLASSVPSILLPNFVQSRSAPATDATTANLQQ